MHAFGSVMDNPELMTIAVVGDGEAETATLEGSWKGVSFINPKHDGAVLPILHLNGYKIAGPTVLARKNPRQLRELMEGHGYEVLEVEGDDLPGMHERFAAVLAEAWGKIKAIQLDARNSDGDIDIQSIRWPMIVLRSPKGGRVRTRSTECRSKARGEHTRFRFLESATTLSTFRSSRTGCCPTDRQSCSVLMASRPLRSPTTTPLANFG